MKTIKELRTENNMTQADLAKALETTKQDIKEWEQKQPDLAGGAIIKLAKFFDVTSDELLGVDNAKENKVYLKADKFKDLAGELSKTKTDIELIRATSELFPSPREIKKGELAIYYYKVHQYLEILFSKLQDVEKVLEDVGSVLYAVTEMNDLKEIVDSKDIDYN